MKLSYTHYSKLAIASTALALSGCDLVYECLSDTRVKFDETSLEIATLNEAYSESIRASVRNSVWDDSYSYTFKIRDGELPEGISSYGLNRRYYFEGAPTEVGEFDFTLRVSISDNHDYYDDDSHVATCNDTEEQRLTFTVVEASE